MTAEPISKTTTTRSRVLRRGLAASAALVVLVLLLQAWWLAPIVGQRLTASARRPVHFDAMWVTLSASFQPVVQLRGIRIDNAPWAGGRRPFARLAAATAVFSWRSLSERRPVIALMTLRDGEVDLEQRADGLRNWRLGNPDDRGPGRYKVLAIRGEQATVRFLHERLGLDFEAKASPNDGAEADAAAAEPTPTRLEVRGTWRGVPFGVDAATSDVLTLLETGRLARVRGRLTSGPARLDFDGRLGDIARDPSVDGRIALAAPSLATFAPLLGTLAGETKAVALAGDVKGEPGRYSLAGATGRVGATDLAGELNWARGAERNLLRARMTSESTHLADLRGFMDRRAARAVEQAATPASAPASAAPVAPARVVASAAAPASGAAPAKRPLDAEISFAARRLHADNMPWLQGAKVEASLADGRLVVPRFEIGIGPGRAAGKATIDLASRPPRGDAEVDLSAIRIESFLPAAAAKSLLRGVLHGRVVVRASGDSAAAVRASASGTVTASLTDGTISSLLDAEMGLQGGRVVRSLLTGAEPIAIRCAAAVLDVERGNGRIRSLVIDTERTRTTGSGSVDLGKEAFDVVLTPEAKQSGLFILDRSIRLHGALREPKHELVARAAPASASPPGCRAERP